MVQREVMATTEHDAQDRADMEQLAAGHDAALNALMARHAEPLFRFLVRLLNNEDDANDLAQETFVRVYRARSKFQPDRRFSTWLYTIAANLARNHLRWRARHPTVSLSVETNDDGITLMDQLPSAGETPRSTLERQERMEAVRNAVQRLPVDLREVLVLCQWEDCSMAEAAEILETTAKAVESRLYRARKALHHELRDWLQEAVAG